MEKCFDPGGPDEPRLGATDGDWSAGDDVPLPVRLTADGLHAARAAVSDDPAMRYAGDLRDATTDELCIEIVRRHSSVLIVLHRALPNGEVASDVIYPGDTSTGALRLIADAALRLANGFRISPAFFCALITRWVDHLGPRSRAKTQRVVNVLSSVVEADYTEERNG